MIGCADSYAPPNRRVCSSSRRAISASTFLDHVCPRVGLDLRHGQAAVRFLQSGAQVIHAPVHVIGHADHQNILDRGRFPMVALSEFRASRRLAGVLYATSYHCPRNGAVRLQNTRKATTMPTRTRVKEMPSTQRTTPGVSPCRAFVVASLGGGWSDMRI